MLQCNPATAVRSRVRAISGAMRTSLWLAVTIEYTAMQEHSPASEEAAPRISSQKRDTRWVVTLDGSWSAAMLARPEVWPGLHASLLATVAKVGTDGSWDLRRVERFDHTGAQLLWNAWGRVRPAELQGLPSQRAMLDRVARYSVGPPRAQSRTLWMRFLALGELVHQVADHARDLVRLVGQLLLDCLRLARSPRDGPWRDVSGHLYRIGATALPITALVGFLIGVVLAYLMAQQLRKFGADAFIVDVLGIALIRELGPVLAAILLAGRSGSAITAQIGVMRVTEELDAMRVMGIAQGYRLVMPRALAMAIAMPLVTVWTTVAALFGGVLSADLAMDITPAYFLSALPAAVEVSNLTLAVGKSVVFGVLIALVGCHYGLRIKPNTESLGQGTTASVVTSITVVILVDALFAVVFKDVGV
jgi:phospholipid/cholesterol/gamma-HCH transport system permease protein